MDKHSFFSQESAKKLAGSVNEVLATTYMLYVKTQNFHWNVEGCLFYSLHKMFESQYEELAEAVDMLAERARQLGFKAAGSMKEFLSLSHIKESAKTQDALGMVHELFLDRQALTNLLHKKISEAQKLADEGTADIYIEHLRLHDKAAWMLKSHLEKK